MPRVVLVEETSRVEHVEREHGENYHNTIEDVWTRGS